jgi:hypothetical protein
MTESVPWIVKLADVCNENNGPVAAIAATYSDGQMKVEARLQAPLTSTLTPVFEVLRAGEIYLLPNGMLRFKEPGREGSTDLSDVFERESQGQLRLCINGPGIEEGFQMKQRVWAQEEHSVPFSQFVNRLKDVSRRE